MKKLDPVTLAYFTAFAVTIFILETLIPKPLPFLKLGLANVVVLLILWNRHYFSALAIVISKSIIGGAFTATLISPMFVISIGASITSFIFMLLAVRYKTGLSIIGVSVLGAVVHNISQLVIVNYLLLNTDSAWKLLPLLMILGVVTGILTGYLAFVLNQSSAFKKIIQN